MTRSEESGFVPAGKVEVGKKVPLPHLDQSLDAKERQVAWNQRQLAFFAWGGLVSAFVIALAFLAASVWIILSGHEVGGTIVGTVDIVGLVTVFVSARLGDKR
jgi:hypothetical protein